MHKPLTFNWNRDATGAFEEEPTKEHGRIECRRIQTMTPLPGTVNFPHIAQIFRIERDRKMCKSRKKSTEIAYGITSVPKDRGTPENLCGKACKDDPLGGKSASSITHLVWLQKLLFVVQRWKGKRG